jgi:N6-L-threonylcarbamoyladenine synthase
MRVLGLDTSNYTTSIAVFNGKTGQNEGQLLSVRAGELGLRQSEALFQHVKQLPELFDRLQQSGWLNELEAVGASTRPRAVEGSYMPCFLAGTSQGKSLAYSLGVPFFTHSHQQGHLAAAAWSAGHLEWLDRPFLAWHLSGGTTELLKVEPEQESVRAEILGGSRDISAGQLIDRTGVRLGFPFPAGKALDELYGEGQGESGFRVRLDGLEFSLSGMENKMRNLLEDGANPADVARFTIDTITDVVVRVTQEAMRRYPGLPVLCSGGVASNRQLRRAMESMCGTAFAQPQYSTDNAMGVAILTWRALEMGRRT